ncbi:chaplin [Streptomyces albipurpureus]|uniref:DUF320 domain-containing protein n=1 Tax=Streptomyces albipurpureus TaxID=2897419 RepID=A0ABT0UP06_9ACTN|nr:chaplin [Streptomyces sp. CWNU-1]MCM2390342.1 DUF320 domain-containing protein [Streptomyces sp. CWNU-1]
MRQVTRKGLITMAAAGSAMALGGYAHADSGAYGGASNSPGVASGNSVQVPVNVPINACGNSVNVVGALNPAFGNSCHNGSSGQAKPGGGAHAGGSQNGGGTQAGGSVSTGGQGGGAQASGGTSNSPGVASGNSVQVPVSVPVNACGNSVDVVGALNPTFGNDCANASSVSRPGTPQQPVTPGSPKPAEPAPGNPAGPSEPRNVPPDTSGTQTGPKTPGERGTPPKADDPAPRAVAQTDDRGALAETGMGTLGAAVPAGAAMLLAGAVLYRRARAAA